MIAQPPPQFYGAQDAVFEVTVHEPEHGRRVPEALVHDLWQARRFAAALATTDGRPLAVLDPGQPNTDQGPDFRDARLRIGETLWAGDVEIHTTSGQWYAHRHHLDAGYDGVVLHVALYADVWTGSLRRADGTVLPEIVLFPHLEAPVRSLLHEFLTRPAGALACAGGFACVPAAVRDACIEELAAERLRQKMHRLAEAYLGAPDLDALLHERLFAALGYAPNADAMATLARRLPLAHVRPCADPLDLEALHLGTAGLLPEPAGLLAADRATADYVMDLRERFDRLRLHLDLTPMARTTWKFFRLRPANFPPLRVAQAGALVQTLLRHDPLGRLLRALRAEAPVAALRRLLRATPGAFWQTHVRLEKASKPRHPAIGQARCDDLITNAVVPVLLLHAEQTNDAGLERALYDVLRALPPTTDAVVRRFAKLGSRPRNAFTAQGVHQLYRTRCTEGRCLTCRIGQALLSQSGRDLS